MATTPLASKHVAQVWAAISLLMVLGASAAWVLYEGLRPRFPEMQPSTPNGYERTRERAEQLIAALSRWKTAHRGYPGELVDLVPTECSAIEPPLVGERQWRYERVSPGQFRLGFFVGPTYECDQFDSNSGTWYVDR